MREVIRPRVALHQRQDGETFIRMRPPIVVAIAGGLLVLGIGTAIVITASGESFFSAVQRVVGLLMISASPILFTARYDFYRDRVEYRRVLRSHKRALSGAVKVEHFDGRVLIYSDSQLAIVVESEIGLYAETFETLQRFYGLRSDSDTGT